MFVTTDDQTNPYENETIHVYERRRNQERLEQIQGLDVATVSSCELDAYFSAITNGMGVVAFMFGLWTWGNQQEEKCILRAFLKGGSRERSSSKHES